MLFVPVGFDHPKSLFVLNYLMEDDPCMNSLNSGIG